MTSDVLVIGGGPAGMFAAITAAKNGANVVLLERNDRLGKKLLITGKGRCNVTNDCTAEEVLQNTPRNGRFLYSAMTAFPPEKTKAFFEGLGCPLKTERGNRVFPMSDRSSSILDCLKRALADAHVTLRTGRVTELLCREGTVLGAKTEEGTYYARAVILATGGASYPTTGSTGDGYALAQSVGHTVVPPQGSLVPLETAGEDCQRMQGLSLRNVGVKLLNAKGKLLYKDFGELLFTHFGVSGPMILSASAHMRNMEPCRYEIYVDMKPALDDEKLDARILREMSENSNKAISNLVGLLLPRAIINPVVRLSGIKNSTKCNQLTKEERKRLAHTIKNLKLTVLRFRPISEAVITSGGVDVNELSPKTMESKLCRNLYFAGEVIDVDAYTGGFNLQIAFSTGFAAGNAQ